MSIRRRHRSPRTPASPRTGKWKRSMRGNTPASPTANIPRSCAERQTASCAWSGSRRKRLSAECSRWQSCATRRSGIRSRITSRSPCCTARRSKRCCTIWNCLCRVRRWRCPSRERAPIPINSRSSLKASHRSCRCCTSRKNGITPRMRFCGLWKSCTDTASCRTAHLSRSDCTIPICWRRG